MNKNHFDVNIIDENNVKILANCKQEIQFNENKEHLKTNSSLVLSRTFSSIKTLRISKDSSDASFSQMGSVIYGKIFDYQGKTPEKVISKISNCIDYSNERKLAIMYSSNIESSCEKISSENNENEKNIQKINNFAGTVSNRLELNKPNDAKSNYKIAIESTSQTFIINQNSKNYNTNTKLEITNKSIFYTPSTICNYYQQSENDGNSMDKNNYILKNNNSQNQPINDNNSSAKSQIKYNKSQLQSGEKSTQVSAFCKVNKNENNNQLAVGFMHDLVNEIKKELVLNISTLDDEYLLEDKYEKKDQMDNKEKGIKLDLYSINEINVQINPIQTVKNLKIPNDKSIQTQNNINFSVCSGPKQFLLPKEDIKGKSSFISQKSTSTKNTTKSSLSSFRKESKNSSSKIPQYKKENLKLNNFHKNNANHSEQQLKNIHTSRNNNIRKEISINGGERESNSVKKIYLNLLKKPKDTSGSNSVRTNNKSNKQIVKPKFKTEFSQLNPTKIRSTDKKLLNLNNDQKRDYLDIYRVVSSNRFNRNINLIDKNSNSLKPKTEVITIDLEKSSFCDQNMNKKKSPIGKKSILKMDVSLIPKTTRNSCISIKKEKSISKHILEIPVPNSLKNNNSKKSFLDKKIVPRNIIPTSAKNDLSKKIFGKKKKPCEQSLKNIKTQSNSRNISVNNEEKIKIIGDYDIACNYSKCSSVMINTENKENVYSMSNQNTISLKSQKESLTNDDEHEYYRLPTERE